MKLKALQKTMARAVMQPLTHSENMRRVAPDGSLMRVYASRFIKPNDRLTSFERLEIYNRQYWFRILSSMEEDFPGVRAILGSRRFEEMCKAYLVECPSQSFTLRNLGARLESWVRKHPKWAGPRQALVVDMARLEWADIEAFDGEAKAVLDPQTIGSAASSDLRLHLQPHVRLLDLRYPVDDLLLEVRHADGEHGFASNAIQERHKHRRVQAVAKLKPQPIFLVVHRLDDSVYFRRVDRQEFAMLLALRNGVRLSRTVEIVFHKSGIAAEEQAARVGQWFHDWAAMGWFCNR
jgi:hypothetical protein